MTPEQRETKCVYYRLNPTWPESVPSDFEKHLRARLEIERLRENLADFKQSFFQKRNLYQDVTCKQSIKTILVQNSENISQKIRQVFPQAL